MKKMPKALFLIIPIAIGILMAVSLFEDVVMICVCSVVFSIIAYVTIILIHEIVKTKQSQDTANNSKQAYDKLTEAIGITAGGICSVLDAHYKIPKGNRAIAIVENYGFVLAWLIHKKLLFPEVHANCINLFWKKHGDEYMMPICNSINFYSRVFKKFDKEDPMGVVTLFYYNLINPQTFDDFSSNIHIKEVNPLLAIDLWTKITILLDEELDNRLSHLIKQVNWIPQYNIGYTFNINIKNGCKCKGMVSGYDSIYHQYKVRFEEPLTSIISVKKTKRKQEECMHTDECFKLTDEQMQRLMDGKLEGISQEKPLDLNTIGMCEREVYAMICFASGKYKDDKIQHGRMVEAIGMRIEELRNKVNSKENLDEETIKHIVDLSRVLVAKCCYLVDQDLHNLNRLLSEVNRNSNRKQVKTKLNEMIVVMESMQRKHVDYLFRKEGVNFFDERIKDAEERLNKSVHNPPNPEQRLDLFQLNQVHWQKDVEKFRQYKKYWEKMKAVYCEQSTDNFTMGLKPLLFFLFFVLLISCNSSDRKYVYIDARHTIHADKDCEYIVKSNQNVLALPYVDCEIDSEILNNLGNNTCPKCMNDKKKNEIGKYVEKYNKKIISRKRDYECLVGLGVDKWGSFGEYNDFIKIRSNEEMLDDELFLRYGIHLQDLWFMEEKELFDINLDDYELDEMYTKFLYLTFCTAGLYTEKYDDFIQFISGRDGFVFCYDKAQELGLVDNWLDFLSRIFEEECDYEENDEYEDSYEEDYHIGRYW